MPRIVHDGAKRWLEIIGPDKVVFSTDKLYDALISLMNEIPEDVQIIGKSGWIDAVQDLTALSGQKDDLSKHHSNIVAHIRHAAERESGLSAATTPKPTIFLSHRQTDHRRAINLANMIIAHGQYDVWLDIWQPSLRVINTLNLSAPLRSILTAMIIEMGLVNARGLIALLTTRTAGSAWVPYEYGRVKTGAPYAVSASIYRYKRAIYEPYMDLGPIIDHNSSTARSDLEDWLDNL